MNSKIFIGLVTHKKSKYYSAVLDSYINPLLYDLSESNVDFNISQGNYFLNNNEITNLKSYYHDINNILFNEIRNHIDLFIKIKRIDKARVIYNLVYSMYKYIDENFKILTHLKCLRALYDDRNTLNLRLNNIEASHRNLISQALTKNSIWTIIFEDDVHWEDSKSVKDLILAIIGSHKIESEIKLYCISKSFTLDQLAISSIAREIDLIQNGSVMYQINFPVTNTLCATVYHNSILKYLLTGLEKGKKMSINLPIDLKINAILRDLVKNQQLNSNCLAIMGQSPISQSSLDAK
jgi:hypothetical protein